MAETSKQLAARISELAQGTRDTKGFEVRVAAELRDWAKDLGVVSLECTHPVEKLEVIKRGDAILVQCTCCMQACLTDQDVWEPIDVINGRTMNSEESSG